MDVITVNSDADAVSLIVEQNQIIPESGSFTYTPGTVLTSTLWNQSGAVYIQIDGKQTRIGGSYNAFSPYVSSSSNTRSVTGCSNTADSQILYYWLERGYDLDLSVTTSDYFISASNENTYYVSDSPKLGEGAMSEINELLDGKDMDNADFIAALNYFCAVKNHSTFGSSTSTSWWRGSYTNGRNSAAYVAAGFDSYFFVSASSNNATSKIFFDSTGLTDVGFSIVRENLDYGEVIRVGIPGHAIYLDGYRLNETSGEYEYHLNYGWGVNTSSTKWYTVSQLEELSLTYVTVDISPDIYVNVTNDRSDYYGGSFLRGLERINHIQNEKSTTFTFDKAVAGKTITQSAAAALTSKVDVDFLNFNVDMIFSSSSGFTSDDAMSFEMADGSIIVNNSGQTVTAIHERGTEKLSLELSGSWIYAGYTGSSAEAIIAALENDEAYYSTKLDTALLAGATGYAIMSGSAADTVTLTASSAIFGKVALGDGANVITIESGSLLCGGIEGSAGTVTVNMELDTADNGALIVSAGKELEDALYSLCGGTFNVTLGSGATASKYILYTGVDAETAKKFTIKLTAGSMKYTLTSKNNKAGDFTLVYDGANIILENAAPPAPAQNVQVFSGGVMTSAAAAMTGVELTQNGNDSMTVLSGGIANKTVVNSSAYIHISSGGIANSTTVNFMGNAHVSYGGIANDNTIAGVMYVFSGAVAGNNTVDTLGTLYLSGTASNTTVNSLGNVYVYSGGIADGVNVKNGSLTVSSGGTATNVAWTPCEGTIFSAYGATVTYASNYLGVYYGSGNKLISSAMTMSGVSLDSSESGSGIMYVMNGGVVNSTTVNSTGAMFVNSSGTAVNTVVKSAGSMYIAEGGIHSGTLTIEDTGVVEVADGGTIDFTVAGRSGSDDYLVSNLALISGTPAFSITVSGDQAEGTYKLAKGAAEFTGTLTIKDSSGGAFGTVTVNGDDFESKGVIYSVDLNDGNLTLTVSNADKPLPEGKVQIFSSGTLVKNGDSFAGETLGAGGNNSMFISAGGSAEATTVRDGGVMHVLSGGIHRGSLQLDGGSVNVTSGGIIDFTVSGMKSTDDYLITDLSLITGAPSFTITVADEQAFGTYKLAQGADNFTGTISVGNGSVDYGEVTVNGSELILDGVGYTLKLQDGDLTFTLRNAAPLPTGKVQIYSKGIIAKQGDSFTGEVIKGGKNTSMVILAGGVAGKTNVSSGGTVFVSSAGLAASTIVNSEGYLYVYAGGVANDTKVNNYGELRISSGGVAAGTVVSRGWVFNDGGAVFNTEVRSDGTLRVDKGGVASNTVVSSGGFFEVFRGYALATVVNGEMYLAGKDTGAVQNTVASGGYLEVRNSGLAVDNNILAGGSMNILSGGSAAFTSVGSGGKVSLDRDAEHYGTMYIGEGAVVSAFAGSVIDFTVAGRDAAESYIINDLSLVKGAPEYTVTVTANQANGVYKLAGNADGFNGTAAIGIVFEFGTLELGKSVNYRGVSYTLDMQNKDLVLEIEGDFLEIGGDLDGNCLADVILVHTKQGYSGAWLSTGGEDIIKWGNLSNVGEGVELLGTGNVSAGSDAGQDIFLENGSTIGAWIVENGKVATYKELYTLKSGMSVIGLGDFDGDGVTDYLLASEKRDYGYVSGADNSWNYIKSLGKEWSIVAIGDLNGDRMDDIVVRHDDGYTGTYLAQENGKVKWASLDNLSDDMTIVGTGDFNGDGVEDILLQKEDGWIGAWLVEDGRVDSFMGIGKNKNTIEQIADFNGDGIDDLRIRTEKGDIGVLYVNGEDDTTWQYFQSVGKEWDTSFALIS
ncbi:MAG: hypothetical protein E7051_08560 [Lentisphaerae bacterium]|nr:hypothetical protein [Lentisphaerota bacterium]